MKIVYSSKNGFVLIAVAALALALICLMGYGLLTTRQAWRESAAKLLDQTIADQNMFGAANGLRSSISNQFSTSAAVNLASIPYAISGATIVADGQSSPIYRYAAQSNMTSISAVQGAASLMPLTAANDPLYGLKATTAVFNYRQTATLGAETSLGSRAARDQVSEMQVEVRQFPLSQFSQFYAANAVLTGMNLAALGRTHANGDLTLNTSCTAVYPMTVSGRLNLGAGVSISAKQLPDAVKSYGVSSTTTTDTRRALLQNAVVDQDVLQTTITTAATLPQMVSIPSVDLGSSARNAQKLCKKCDILVYYDSGAKSFAAKTQTNSIDSQTQAAMKIYTDQLLPRANGHPVIEFDVARLEVNGSRWTSYYLYSNDPAAIVIVRNAGTLPRNLSIVTPHEVWIDTAFNTPANPSQVKAASIVTSGRVIGVEG